MTSLAWQQTQSRLGQFLALTKPRVVSLIVFCAVIGMFLAVPFGALDARFAWLALAATVGIALVAGAAAAINCLVEQKIDAVMARTRGRPLPRGQLTPGETLTFAAIVGGSGLALLYFEVNALTMWLTLGTFIGYAIVYTVLLKPLTPQNIVIGGASGAMPPVLGWAAVNSSSRNLAGLERMADLLVEHPGAGDSHEVRHARGGGAVRARVLRGVECRSERRALGVIRPPASGPATNPCACPAWSPR